MKKHDVDYDEALLVGMIQASLRDAIGLSRPVPALKGRPKVRRPLRGASNNAVQVYRDVTQKENAARCVAAF